jgi:hypothetical protein
VLTAVISTLRATGARTEPPVYRLVHDRQL